MNWKPNKWIAALLCVFSMPLGMLYAAKAKWAGAYLIVQVGVAAAGTIFSRARVGAVVILVLLNIVCVIHALYMARAPLPIERPWYSQWYSLVAMILLVYAPLNAVRALFFETFIVSYGNMAPALVPGDLVVVGKWGCGKCNFPEVSILGGRVRDMCAPKRGDIMVLENPSSPGMKVVQRVVGVPGDEISYQGKILALNGRVVSLASANGAVGVYGDRFSGSDEILGDARYTVLHRIDHAPREGQWVVPEGHYFAMGDHRDNSMDSRHWGFVPQENMIGKLIFSSR